MNVSPSILRRCLAIAVVMLILKTCWTVASLLPAYLTPNFDTDFLLGREPHFYGPYQYAFYIHILSGPFSLLVGMWLLSHSLRMRWPVVHRQLGRFQVACIVGLVVPSGLWMSCFAQAGNVAASAFATLAVATGWAAYRGWRQAVKGNFASHRMWMLRTFTLLCSAVVIRLLGGLASIFGVYWEWFDPLAAWASWLIPLAILEVTYPRIQRQRPTDHRPARRGAILSTENARYRR